MTESRLRRPVFLLIACLLLGREGRGEEGDSFGWPLSIQPSLSSTFGETRQTAFHAGIDVKTWGRTGYEVRALGDGHVWRLRTSPWGYGRAAYLKLEDGRILVYAHLAGFAPRLAARVEEVQRREQQYSVDIWGAAEEIPVRQGEVIAWTGRSGAGPPHLHVELRDADNVPINPLLHGFQVLDITPPTLRRIALIPVGRESQVDGGHDPVSVGLRWDGQAFAAGGSLAAHGRVGIGVLGHDRADAAPNKLAPYRTRLSVDGRPVFAAAYDRFSYSDAHQVSLDRTRLAFPGGEGDFFNLFRVPGNRLGFYQIAAGDGLLACGAGAGGVFLDKGLHQVVVESEDAAGNRSLARLQVRVDAPPAVVQARIAEEGSLLQAEVQDADDDFLEAELAHSRDGKSWKTVEKRKVATGALRWELGRKAPLWRVRVRDGAGSESFAICALPAKGSAPAPRLSVESRAYPDFVELIIRAEQPLAAPPRARAPGRRLVVRQTGLQEYRVDVPLRVGGAETLVVEIQGRGREGVAVQERVPLNQRPALPGEESRLDFGGGDAEMAFAAQSAYAPFFPQCERFRPEDTEHLISAGIGYAFGPSRVSFDDKVEIRLRYPEGAPDPEKIGLYTEGKDGKWTLVGSELDAGRRTVGGRVRELARYALFADETPPTIEALHPAPGAVLRVRQPRLSARIDDPGSGIGREEDVVMELDGRRLISEYDPEAGTVEFLVREELGPGAHRLAVTVRDMSGNQASAQAEFRIE